MYAYALFGLYSLTISPLVTRFINYGEPNALVGIFGFVILIAEMIALHFKLKMIRIRTEESRIAFFDSTGIDYIPYPGKIVIFGLFARMILRLAVLMVSITALGFPATEAEMSIVGLFVVSLGFFLDMCGLIYIYVNTGIEREVPEDQAQYRLDEKEAREWNRINIPLASTTKYFWKEFIADIILNIYALMLFTVLWKFINDFCIDLLRQDFNEDISWLGAASDLFPLLFILAFVILMPTRVAYWIEDGMMAFIRREKMAMWSIFILASVYAFAPAFIEFFSIYFIRDVSILKFFHSDLINVFLSCTFIVLIILVKLSLVKIPIRQKT